MSNISGIVKSIQDIMRKDVGVDGDAQRIGQLVWMLFLKIFDDQESQLELTEDSYTSPIPEALRWRNWALNDEGITGDELSGFINNQLFPALKELDAVGLQAQRAAVIRNVFEDAYNYMKSGQLIRQVINKVNEINFNRTADRHLFGDIYEQILKDLQSAGNSGEFYTPRAVTQFMVDMVNPKLGEVVLDPACGTGGFLTCAIEHLREQAETSADWKKLQSSINGVEKKALPHLLCTTNMLLHGIEVPLNIKHDNMLSRPIKDHQWRKKVDVILTNPPFGGSEEDGIESNFPSAYRTRETADLFLYLIVELLKDGGRAAVVLPDGTLFGEGIKTRLKEKLLKECNLHTIIQLPKGVFSPYTTIKTNLLFFEKGTPTKEIWYYEHQYPEGYKSYSKTKPIRIEEFEVEKAWWDKREANEYAWKVSLEDIKSNNFNLDINNPNKVDPTHVDPQILARKYDQAVKDVSTTEERLKPLVMRALDRYVDTDSIAISRIFSEKYRHLIHASNGIAKLRQLVLQLAIDGRILGSNNASWNKGKFGDIATFEYGRSLPVKNRHHGKVPVYGSNGVTGYHDQPLIEKPAIIIGRKGSSGALNMALEPFWATDVTYYSVPPKDIDLKFFYLMLSSLNLPSLSKGIKPGLNRNDVYVLDIAYPNLEVQREIIFKYEELISLCNKLEKQNDQLAGCSEHLFDALLSQLIVPVNKNSTGGT